MIKRIIMMTVLLILVSSIIFAGDRAEFINLGFSEDESVFLFGQYGKNDSGTILYADIIYHDLTEGAVITDESASFTYPAVRSFGQNSLNALLMGLREFQEANDIAVDYTNNGTTLFFQLPGQETRDIVSFSDYTAGMIYSASLITRPTERLPGSDSAAAVTVFQSDRNNNQRRFDLGSLIVPLEDVYDLQLKQAVISPSGTYLVLVYQTKVYDENLDTTNFRYHAMSTRIE